MTAVYPKDSDSGKWTALSAALLGWMFDGFEMGLFPLVARPAIRDLMPGSDEANVTLWFSIATALFLIGAATGGVLFGWLGDRLGRVRAMTLSVLTYAIFSGLCGLTTSPAQIAGLRFISALGMGGEWSLGVALVMEIWPDKSRALLAGLIGASANFGYLMVGVLSLGLDKVLPLITTGLADLGLSQARIEWLTANSGWRILLLLGAAPALLTFLIRLFVPESRRWEEEKKQGKTSHWAAVDLLAVFIGAGAAGLLVYLWTAGLPFAVSFIASLPTLAVVILGYSYPVYRYLGRAALASGSVASWAPTLRRMYLGACLSGVALLGTWASIQWAPIWADQLAGPGNPHVKAYAQIASALGAVVGTMIAALMGDWLGRRPTYALLCVASLAAALGFFHGNTQFDNQFLVMLFLAGATTASFYGWLPLYLPELFPTTVRATGQGFGFNLGRIIAAVGNLQMTNLVVLVGGGERGYPRACSIMSCIYLVGLVLIMFAPETRGKPLPD